MVEGSKDQLLAAIETGWNQFQENLGSLTYEQATLPTDDAGWSIKDYLAYLAAWEEGVAAVLERNSFREQMGIDPVTWGNHDFDKMKEIIHQRYDDLPLREVASMYFDAHERLIEAIQRLSDADLQRPCTAYQPDADADFPVIDLITSNTTDQYVKYEPIIDAIAEKHPVTVANLLEAMQNGWNDFNRFLDTLTNHDVTDPADDVGWTVKDHVAHILAWENAMNALLQKLPLRVTLGVDRETWDRGDIDRINAEIWQHNQDLTWAVVRRKFEQIHQELVGRVRQLNDADLQRPYADFAPESTDQNPVLDSLVGNTIGHYAEHLPWIKAIVKRGE